SAARIAHGQGDDGRGAAEAEVDTRVIGGEVARTGENLANEPAAVRQYGGDDRAGREARQLHLEPVARAAGAAQQDQLPADRVDRHVHVTVVVEVRGGQPAAVRPRALEPDEAGRVRKLAVQVLQHLHRAGIAGQVRDGN